MNKLIESFLIAIPLTLFTFWLGSYLGWITEVNWLEVFAVVTSYSCTWLCSRQSRLNYPVGVVTTIAYTILFWQWSMPALALFNLYLVFSLAYGWFRWGPDGKTRPVSFTKPKDYIFYALFGLVVLGMFLGANLWINPEGISALNPTDIKLAVASGVAQLMLDNKKLENWFIWAGINIVSIPFFLDSGLVLVAFQYVFFLLNTGIGFILWLRSMKVVKGLWLKFLTKVEKVAKHA